MDGPMAFHPDSEAVKRLTLGADKALEIYFFLLPAFPIYALIPALESIRITNQNTGRDLFHWKLLGTGSASVRSSNGLTMSLDGSIQKASVPDLVLIFAGNEPTQGLSPALLSWLRLAHAGKSLMGGMDTGVFALAEAGLLRDRTVTLHWEALPLFRECHPDINVVERLYVVDGPIITCAGGMAVLDMMLELIRLRHGSVLAQVVANGFVYSQWRPAESPQRARGLNVTAGVPPDDASRDVWSAILRPMEENIAVPLNPVELADRFYMSRRTLERLFRKNVGESVARYYLKMRIDMARDFLFYSDLPILSVALACGFSSQSSFSRAFQKIMGMTPSNFRALRKADRISPYRPRARYHIDGENWPMGKPPIRPTIP